MLRVGCFWLMRANTTLSYVAKRLANSVNLLQPLLRVRTRATTKTLAPVRRGIPQQQRQSEVRLLNRHFCPPGLQRYGPYGPYEPNGQL